MALIPFLTDNICVQLRTFIISTVITGHQMKIPKKKVLFLLPIQGHSFIEDILFCSQIIKQSHPK